MAKTTSFAAILLSFPLGLAGCQAIDSAQHDKLERQNVLNNYLRKKAIQADEKVKWFLEGMPAAQAELEADRKAEEEAAKKREADNVYCYRTLGSIDCYYREQEKKIVNRVAAPAPEPLVIAPPPPAIAEQNETVDSKAVEEVATEKSTVETPEEHHAEDSSPPGRGRPGFLIKAKPRGDTPTAQEIVKEEPSGEVADSETTVEAVDGETADSKTETSTKTVEAATAPSTAPAAPSAPKVLLPTTPPTSRTLIQSTSKKVTFDSSGKLEQ